MIGTDALSMFTEYGVAINGKAVCDGYAFMFKYFMDSLEIENHYVRSSLPNHAWNQVKINDEWYWVDCTWGDTDEVVNMKYDYQWFLQSGQRVYEGFVVDEHNGTVCDGTHRKEILESLGIDFDTTVQDDDSLIELIFDDSGTKVVGFTPSNNKKAVVPSSVLVIAPNAFYECFDMKSLVISEGVQVIDIAACLHCRQLEEVVLPKSLTEIRMQAFAGCMSLKKVIIPSKITKIEEGTFLSCNNLESIILPEGLKSIEDYAFSDCGLKSIVIPDNVTEIGACAFVRNPELEEIILPKDLKTIGSGVFASCKKLKKLILPDGLTSISEDVFLDPLQGEITSEPEIVWRGVSYKNSQDFFEAFNQIN